MLTCLKESFKRFATGCYAVWYPQLQRLESRDLPEKLKLLGEMDWLHVSLSVQTPSADGFGMHGSGMFVLNPPWTLPEVLKAELPYLVKALGRMPARATRWTGGFANNRQENSALRAWHAAADNTSSTARPGNHAWRIGRQSLAPCLAGVARCAAPSWTSRRCTAMPLRWLARIDTAGARLVIGRGVAPPTLAPG